MTEKRTYQKSPLTNSQEKLLLAEIDEAVRPIRLREYYGLSKPEPAGVKRARAVLKAHTESIEKFRNTRRAAINAAHEAARKAVIFAETKEAAQKAVADLSAALSKIAKGKSV